MATKPSKDPAALGQEPLRCLGIYAHVRLRLQHDAVNRLSDALRPAGEDQPLTRRR